MTTEAKVGAFTVTGLALLMSMVMHFSGIKLGGDEDYTLYVSFSQAVGINPDADVLYAGVPAGKVKSIEADGLGVEATLKMDPKIKVPQDAVITISMNGVMGDKFISILPEKARSHEYLQDGDRVIGQDEHTMDSMLEDVGKAVNQVHELLGVLNNMLGDPRVQSSFIHSAENVQEITKNMRDMTAAFSHMAANSESDVAQMAQNLSAMTGSLMQAAAGVNTMVQDFSGDGETAANLRMAVTNIASTSQRIEHMAQSLEGVVTDPKVADDLKVTLSNARDVSQKAKDMMGGLDKIQVEGGADVLYSGKADHWMTNVDLDVHHGKNNFMRIGMDDLGAGNRFNAQAGTRRGNFGQRAGIVDSKIGVGLDAYAGDRWKFSAEAYDPNEATLKLRAQYRLNDDTYLVGQMNDVNRSDERATYVGIRQSF